MTLRTADGRVFRTVTEDVSARFPEVTDYTSGSLRVVAVDGPTRDSAPWGTGLEAVTRIAPRL